ncbi:sensor histidine kinase [Nocardia sp. NPDC020380]|uniref:sensor histidine kinase n=1 Tax=Nocardia sp. NPDC020380 TaxID=3364309 RepID=UPI0037927F1E
MSRLHLIRRVIVDVALALVFGFMAYESVHTSSIGVLLPAAGPAIAIASGIALLFRRYYPLPVLTVVLLADIAVGTTFPGLLAMYTVVDRYGNRMVTWLSTVATIVVLLVPWAPGWTGSLLAPRAAVLVPLMLASVALGLWTNQRRQTLEGLRERAEQAERERDLLAAAAVEAERIRIARELHDIVAHRISQVTVLAGALEVSADGKSAEMAGTIRETGTKALNEMRELLGVLRDSDVHVPLRPAPDLAAVRELLDEAVASGQRLEIELPEPLPEVPGPVGRAVYRLVQESLTNAAKHAAGAEVRVAMRVHGAALEVDVRNGRGDRIFVAAQGSGSGLVGMRERVVLAGGTLHAGPLATGGFAVHARLPLISAETEEVS